MSKGRPDVGAGRGCAAPGVSLVSERETKITPVKLQTGHVMSCPVPKREVHHAPSSNSSNLCNCEVVNVTDPPDDQREETCAWIFEYMRWNSRGGCHTPLVLDKIVALATWVRPRLAVSDQFARNQTKQNTDARLAVSRVVRGSRAAEVDSGSTRDEGRCGGLFEVNQDKDVE